MDTITLRYNVTFGKGDGSEAQDFEIEVTPEEYACYKRAIVLGEDLDDYPELEEVCNRAYPRIEELEKEYAHELDMEWSDGFDVSVWVEARDPEDEDIEEYLRLALEAGDIETAVEIYENNEYTYSGNLIEYSLKTALEIGKKLGSKY